MAEPLHHLQCGPLTIDLARYRVLLRGQPLALTYREYALLTYLAGRAGQVVSMRRLLEEGLGRHDPGGLRLVEEHLRRLKGLIEREPGCALEDLRPEGYRLICRASHVTPI